jgi:hypothetical protein
MVKENSGRVQVFVVKSYAQKEDLDAEYDRICNNGTMDEIGRILDSKYNLEIQAHANKRIYELGLDRRRFKAKIWHEKVKDFVERLAFFNKSLPTKNGKWMNSKYVAKGARINFHTARYYFYRLKKLNLYKTSTKRKFDYETGKWTNLRTVWMDMDLWKNQMLKWGM